MSAETMGTVFLWISWVWAIGVFGAVIPGWLPMDVATFVIAFTAAHMIGLKVATEQVGRIEAEGDNDDAE